jgi:phosphatidylglycerophosphate synthase
MKRPQTLIGALWLVEALCVLPFGLFFLRDTALVLYLGAALSLVWAHAGVARAFQRCIGLERMNVADVLTLSRWGVGTLLIALVLSWARVDRAALLGVTACTLAVVSATVTDWLDGPLAQRLGPTRIGGALDIEGDSWLTLAVALAAVSWGGLPWWVLIAPLLHYVRSWRRWQLGRLPRGHDPWWAVSTGALQMGLLLGALLPIEGDVRDAILSWASIPISAVQSVSMLALMRERAAPSHGVSATRKGAAGHATGD